MSPNIAMITYWVEGSHRLRDGVLEQLNDAELSFSPGGANISFGQLLKELGELEHMYTQSLKTLKHDWSYKNEEEGLISKTTQLKTWFDHLDKEMKTVIEALTVGDLQKEIDRTDNVIRTIEDHLSIYIQALMIFFGKAVVYLRAMNKPLPDALQHYIG